MIETFAGYNNLGYHLWSLRVCKTSVQALLSFKFSIEKLGVILIGSAFIYYVVFFLAAFDILSLFHMFMVLLLCAKVNFFSGSIYLVFCMLLVLWIGIFFRLGMFSSMMLKIFLCLRPGFLLLPYFSITFRFGLFIVS